MDKIMTTEELTNNVLLALDEIRPFLNSDGGDITLISIDDDKHVKVRLEGACISCSVNQMTLKAGVETTIKKYAPQIETVVNIM
jgi:Fe-S cluster biogenesis protein NfuA